MKQAILVLAVLLFSAALAPAAEEYRNHLATAQSVQLHPEEEPQIPAHPDWAAPIVATIGFLFAAALAAGLLSRGREQETPDAHSHDEPPGAAHGHHAH